MVCSYIYECKYLSKWCVVVDYCQFVRWLLNSKSCFELNLDGKKGNKTWSGKVIVKFAKLKATTVPCQFICLFTML